MAERTSSLRVLIVDHTAATSGAEIALVRLLRAIDRARITPSVLLLSDGPLHALLDDAAVRTAVLPMPTAVTAVSRDQATGTVRRSLTLAVRTAAVIPALIRAIRGAHVDLVVANSLKAAMLLAVAAPAAGLPWVWHLHDRLSADYLSRSWVTALQMLARFGPQTVIVNSLATRGTVGAVPASRVHVAYPAAPVPDAAVRRPPHTPVFGLLGRIAPTKGHDTFVHAAALTSRDAPDARFRIIGEALFNDHSYADRVRGLPERLGIDARVEFCGWTSQPTAALRALTVFVHASAVPEPFGQVIVEAMLAGTPVIGTDAGGAHEILDPDGSAVPIADGVRRSDVGLLVAPGDAQALARAMDWMLAHADEREAMARVARRVAAERFDIGRTAAGVADVWEHAAAGRGRSDWMDA